MPVRNCVLAVIAGFLHLVIYTALLVWCILSSYLWLKNKAGDFTDLNNNGPTSVAKCITKVIELIVFNRKEVLLDTAYNQFGYKSKHSTDMCVYSLSNSSLLH